ncbi:hypothetical protein AB0C13_39955, partial [Streptomyces sp. NPDC049099]|uniref:hypothetical protein n=1 Tax=Streptomyces sp. NPDC049099 TaxID=3155768 RepID=UPI00342D604A
VQAALDVGAPPEVVAGHRSSTFDAYCWEGGWCRATRRIIGGTDETCRSVALKRPQPVPAAA